MADQNKTLQKLIQYIKHGDEESVKKEFETQPHIKTQKNMKSLAKEAVEAACKNIVITLLEHGLNVNAALDIVVKSGKHDLIEFILDRGADVNEGLYFAVKANNKDAITHLLAHGADINTNRRNGYTPLDIALMQKNIDIELVEFLIKAGAGVNRQSNNKKNISLFQKIIDEYLLTDGRSGYSYKTKIFTLYAIKNTKQSIAYGYHYELSIEVKNLAPFDIYLRKTQDGQTSCEFVRFKQGKIEPSMLFTILETDNNVKQYIKNNDTILNMFIKFDEITNNALYQYTSKKFIYCSNSSFKTDPRPYLEHVYATNYECLCELKHRKWTVKPNFLFREIKYILLKLLGMSSYFKILQEKYKIKLNYQINNLIKNQNFDDKKMWSVKEIAMIGLRAIQEYLRYLRNCKIQIDSSNDIDHVKEDLPEEFKLFFNRPDELQLLKNRAVYIIKAVSKSFKSDKNLFSYFSKFDDDITVRVNIDNFVKHFSIYTDCPTSEELDEKITMEINTEFISEGPIRIPPIYLQYISKWIYNFKNKKVSVFTDICGRKLLNDIKIQICNTFNKSYIEDLRRPEYYSQVVNFLNRGRDRYVTVEDDVEIVFDCLGGTPKILNIYSDRIKYLTLYAITNNKLATSSSFQFELSTEVKNLVPFDNIYLKKTKNVQTSFEFIRIKQDKIDPIHMFAILKTDINVKQYIKADDTIIKMFFKFDDINDNPLYQNTSKKFIYCTSSNFNADPYPVLKYVFKNNNFLCGIKHNEWKIDQNFVFLEIKYILLNLFRISPYFKIMDEIYKIKFYDQINNETKKIQNFINISIQNENIFTKKSWNVNKLANDGLSAIQKYLTYLGNCKREIENAIDIENVKNNLPLEFELLFTHDLALLKKSAISKINEESESLKFDTNLFSYFSGLDDISIKKKIKNFVKHVSIYTDCPRSDELDEIIIKKINEQFEFDIPILISAHCLQYFSRWINNLKIEKGSVFTDRDGIKFFHDIRMQIFNAFNKLYHVELQGTELHNRNNEERVIHLFNNTIGNDNLEETEDRQEFECLGDGAKVLSGFSYQIKYLTLYAIKNTKRDTSSICQFELSTEVMNLVPFDDIYLKKVRDGHTSFEFIQIKQTKREPLMFFAMLTTDYDIKKYIKGNDTIVKMFIKFDEIKDNPIYQGTSKKFLYCTSSNFKMNPNPFFEQIPENFEFLCGIKHKHWIMDPNFVFIEIKYILLNLLRKSPYFNEIDEVFQNYLKYQIRIQKKIIGNRILNPDLNMDETALLPVETIANEGLIAITNYLKDLSTCKKKIASTYDIENMKTRLPDEFKILCNRSDELEFLKNRAVFKINEVAKSFKIDKALFSYFSKFNDNQIREKIDYFVKHLSIYTDCPTSDELDEIIEMEIREEFKFDIPILISAHCGQYFSRWISNFKNNKGQVFTDRGGRKLFYDISTQIINAFNKFYNEQQQ